MIVVHQVIVQPVDRTEIEIHARVHVTHVQVLIVPPVHMVIDQNVVMIVVHRVIVQPVVHTEAVIHVHLQIAHVVARRVDRQIDAMTVILDRAIHDPLQTNPAEVTHTVAIAHVQAMIAMPVRLRVTANAVADQIVPEVVSPMIAKSVHAVALAKSA
jgi:hypothetical protein